jgi:penicillin-insensitive murein endopeptidase
MIEGFGAIAGLVLSVWPTLGGALPAPAPLVPIAAVAPATFRDTPATLLTLSDDELRKRIEADSAALGSLSIGAPSSGLLLNPVALPSDARWVAAPGSDSWATAETIEAIAVAVDTVCELYPDTPPVAIGDISDSDGGRLKAHQTHQVGRDVDFGYYYKAGKGTWYTPGTAANMDLPRNWALVRGIVVRTDVEAILLDTRIQRLLYNYALSIGEEKGWLDRLFQFPKGSPDAIIRHVAGHRTHYHVRFYSPVAQELGRRAHPTLVDLHIIKPPVYSVAHLVRPGETLGSLARRYGTSVRAIMQANGLTTTQIRAGRVCRIPLRTPAPPPQPLVVPHRLLPSQTPVVLSSIDWPTAETLYGPAGDH